MTNENINEKRGRVLSKHYVSWIKTPPTEKEVFNINLKTFQNPVARTKTILDLLENSQVGYVTFAVKGNPKTLEIIHDINRIAQTNSVNLNFYLMREEKTIRVYVGIAHPD